jgi:hypothetical protein
LSAIPFISSTHGLWLPVVPPIADPFLVLAVVRRSAIARHCRLAYTSKYRLDLFIVPNGIRLGSGLCWIGIEIGLGGVRIIDRPIADGQLGSG